jgi:hypothetical protein
MTDRQINPLETFKDDPFLGYILHLTDEFRIACSGTSFEGKFVVVLAGPKLWRTANKQGLTEITVNGLQLSINRRPNLAPRDFQLFLVSKNGFEFQLTCTVQGEKTLTSFQIRKQPDDPQQAPVLDRILRRLLEQIPGMDQPDNILIRRPQ